MSFFPKQYLRPLFGSVQWLFLLNRTCLENFKGKKKSKLVAPLDESNILSCQLLQTRTGLGPFSGNTTNIHHQSWEIVPPDHRRLSLSLKLNRTHLEIFVKRPNSDPLIWPYIYISTLLIWAMSTKPFQRMFQDISLGFINTGFQFPTTVCLRNL